jgi:hypothetical protein
VSVAGKSGEGEPTVQYLLGLFPLTRLAHVVRSAPSPHRGEGSGLRAASTIWLARRRTPPSMVNRVLTSPPLC